MVLPFVGAGIATGFGVVAGLSVGPYLFKFIKPTSFRLLHEDTDHDHKVAAPPHGLNVQTEMREALPLLEPWLTDSGYHRVAMINRLMNIVWPTMTKAILDLIITGDVYNTVLYPQLKAQVFDKFAFIEDIFLGPHSMKHGKPNLEEFVEGMNFHLGSNAPRMGGFKVVPTADDEVLMELSAAWGSTMVLDVHAVLKFGALRIVVPLQVSNVNFKADIRVVLRPLVEKFPCLGGVTISLLSVPVVDCSIKLLKGVDLMALPFLPQIIYTAMKLVLEPITLPILNKPLVPGVGLVLPNGMSFPIMPNFGLPPIPVGAIKVEVLSLEGIRGGNDLYCRVEVRRGRYKQTRTINNNRNPEFNEDFALIMDTFENDSLRIAVYQDDMGWADTCLGEIILPFAEVVGTRVDPKTGKDELEYVRAPFVLSCEPTMMMMPFNKLKKGLLKSATGSMKNLATGKSFSAARGTDANGAPKPSIFSKEGMSCLFRKKSKKSKVGGEVVPEESEPSGTSPKLQHAASAPPQLTTQQSMGPGTLRAATAAPGVEPGLGKDDMGRCKFRVTFIPFNEPKFDDEEREAKEASKVKDPRLSMFPPPVGRTANVLGQGSGSTLRGVLTVQLVRCIDLAPEGAKDMATYVKFLVANDEKDELQTSSTLLNETSPRWGDKFDFVLIPAATSELHVEVFNRAGAFSNLVGSLLRKKQEDKDTSMGKLLIKVDEVARNGRIKDVWALQDAERGYIELSLSWQTCYVSQQ